MFNVQCSSARSPTENVTIPRQAGGLDSTMRPLELTISHKPYAIVDQRFARLIARESCLPEALLNIAEVPCLQRSLRLNP